VRQVRQVALSRPFVQVPCKTRSPVSVTLSCSVPGVLMQVLVRVQTLPVRSGRDAGRELELS
jgi:hypothetical protein